MGNEKYTQKVIEAFQSAQQIAALHYNQELSSVHMLMGLTKEPEGLLNTIFSECHTDVPMLQARLEQLLKKIPSVKGSSQLSMSTEMVRVIGKAQQLADSMHDEYISTEHILMGIVSESAASPSCSRARCAMRWNSAPLIRAPECHTNMPECMDFAHRSGNE